MSGKSIIQIIHDLFEAAASVAELEAERHSWREANDRVWLALPRNLPGDEPGTIGASVHVAWMTTRIAELEAELRSVHASNWVLVADVNRLEAERDGCLAALSPSPPEEKKS